MGAKIQFETSNVNGFIVNLGRDLITPNIPICFIDRDGVVINEVTRRDKTFGSLREISDFKYCEGARETLINLVSRNIPIVIVSNQPDIASKHITLDFLTKINESILKDTGIISICSCPHAASTKCLCRKPQTGILKYFKDNFGTPLNKSVIIGDRLTDMQMGVPDGLYQVHIDPGNLCLSTAHRHSIGLSQSEKILLEIFK
jgi:D-glycero-D-manno-heptose 1,7-bisphosphate phosphatase